jgi:hypothetical protein
LLSSSLLWPVSLLPPPPLPLLNSHADAIAIQPSNPPNQKGRGPAPPSHSSAASRHRRGTRWAASLAASGGPRSTAAAASGRRRHSPPTAAPG